MRYMVALMVLSLSGCATGPSAKALGDGRYSVVADSHATATAAYSEAVKEAGDFCASSGKGFVAQSSTDQSDASLHFFRTSLVFACD